MTDNATNNAPKVKAREIPVLSFLSPVTCNREICADQLRIIGNAT
jgi:hypothetical protein